MRAFATLLLILNGLFTWGQVLEHSLLWRIVPANAGIAASYLFGTVHSKDHRAFQFGDSTLPALERCDLAVGELDLERSVGGAAELFAMMRMPDGKRLEDLYTKKQWIKLKAKLEERLGVGASMASGIKPFFVMAMLAETEMQGERSEVLDQYLINTAKANGQRVLGIETVVEQMTALDRMSLKKQAEMLLDHLEHDSYAAEMNEMLDAYASQDLERLMLAAEKGGSMPKEMENALITERNTRMVHRMDSLLNMGESAFFLIGAAHLPGPSGLIAGLRNKGYSVEAVLPKRVELWQGK